MQRREFLGSITSPVLVACAVCMGACSKTASQTSGTVSANFSIDLGTSLLGVGSSIIQSGVIVVRLAAGNVPNAFTAVQVACTHEGTAINYNASAGQFICPNHGSTFTTAGTVTLGPASSSLKQYAIAISGTTMTISG